MIIAIPVEENKQIICASFGRAPYFLLKNIELDETTFAPNPAVEAQGGAGVKAAQFIVDNRVDVLITMRCGQNAAEIFESTKILIYKAEGVSVSDNLKAFSETKLTPLTHFHAGFHGRR